ncbi:MAG: stage II sporulation protein D [Oscillospiraceae bacterium]|nr:stage II sporulation protein D [Oscillospiraceae bacterium]
MKKKFCIYSILCLVFTAMPLIPAMMISPKTSAQEKSNTEISETSENPTEQDNSNIENLENQVYHVLDITSNEILEVPVRDYIIGAVGAEMPVSFETEALKAQAVAAHTYAERQVILAENRTDLNGADFSNDPNQYQAFYTKQQLQELYGENFNTYYEKLCNIVDAVLPEILFYDNEPIIAAFHAMSSGKTESAQNVWGSEVAYLQSVDSSSDISAPKYQQEISYSSEQVQELLTSAHTGLILGTDTEHWFGEPTYSDAGTVLQIPVGTSIFTGQELRTIFSLRSACFEITYQDKNFIFTTKGYGHGVGLSQYGANAMALQGLTYREILAYYYPDTILKTV